MARRPMAHSRLAPRGSARRRASLTENWRGSANSRYGAGAIFFVGRDRGQVFSLAFEIVEGVRLEYIVRLEKFIELHARGEAEQPAHFGIGQVAELEFLKGQRFERASLDIAHGAEAARQIIGNADGNFHVGAGA